MHALILKSNVVKTQQNPKTGHLGPDWCYEVKLTETSGQMRASETSNITPIFHISVRTVPHAKQGSWRQMFKHFLC